MHLSCREWRSRCLFPNRRRRLSRYCHVCFVRRTNHSHRTPFYVSCTTCKLPAVTALPACLAKHTAKLSLRTLGRPADAYHIFHDGPNTPSSLFGIAFDSDPASALPSHLNLPPGRVFLKCQRLQRGFSRCLQVRLEERRLCLLRQRPLRRRQAFVHIWLGLQEWKLTSLVHCGAL